MLADEACARTYIASGPTRSKVVSASRSGSNSRSISESATPTALFADSLGRLVEGRMHEVMRDPAGSGQRRQLACRHFAKMEPALAQQFLRHDHDLMPCQRRADDRVRRGNVIGETIARLHLDLAAVLLEVRNAVGLEQDLDVGMFAVVARRGRVRDPVLARLDLAQLQFRDGGVVDPRFQRRSLERIDMRTGRRDRSAHLTNTGSAFSAPVRQC